jgi:uncharacterized protein (TIGR03067 family)
MSASLLLAADSPADPSKKDVQRLQGTWTLVADEVNGKREEVRDAAELVIRENKMTMRAKVRGTDVSDESEFRVDATKTPKELDAIYTGQKDPERKGVAKAIYRLSGDELTICGNAIGSEPRPTKFKTRPGDGLSLSVWKRKRR